MDKLQDGCNGLDFLTDSVNLSQEARNTAAQEISSSYGDTYSKPRNFKGKSKGAQEAHNLDLSITPPVNVDCSIPPFSKVELFAPRPSADELRIVIFVDMTLSIEPVNVLSTIILSEIVESSIVEFVNVTLFPVPSLN